MYGVHVYGFDYSVLTISINLFVFSASVIHGVLNPDLLHGCGWYLDSLLDFVPLANRLLFCTNLLHPYCLLAAFFPRKCCYLLLAAGSSLVLFGVIGLPFPLVES